MDSNLGKALKPYAGHCLVLKDRQLRKFFRDLKKENPILLAGRTAEELLESAYTNRLVLTRGNRRFFRSHSRCLVLCEKKYGDTERQILAFSKLIELMEQSGLTEFKQVNAQEQVDALICQLLGCLELDDAKMASFRKWLAQEFELQALGKLLENKLQYLISRMDLLVIWYENPAEIPPGGKTIESLDPGGSVDDFARRIFQELY